MMVRETAKDMINAVRICSRLFWDVIHDPTAPSQYDSHSPLGFPGRILHAASYFPVKGILFVEKKGKQLLEKYPGLFSDESRIGYRGLPAAGEYLERRINLKKD